MPVLEVKTLEAALADSIAPYRFNLFTFGLFAAVALLLASVGIYGTLAYSTSRRTQEIGIRLALGAARGEVVAMVIRQGMTVALIGTLVGLVIGVAVARVMRGSCTRCHRAIRTFSPQPPPCCFWRDSPPRSDQP